jgi:Cdc6-like AAA superfamily ATPase
LVQDELISIDYDQLLAYLVDDARYGATLTRIVFASNAIREAWLSARAGAEGTGQPLRLLLNLEARAPILNSLRWELLCDPTSGNFLFLSQRILGARYLTSIDLAPITLRPAAQIRAVVFVASPTNVRDFGLVPINVEVELQRIGQALGSVDVTVLASGTANRPSLERLNAALVDGPDILYILSHGVNRDNEPYFFLEGAAGEAKPVGGAELARLLASLQRRPLLTVVSTCESAGNSNKQEIPSAFAAPWFASAGIPAIVAMQGAITTETVAVFMPTFFTELRRDGKIDRAMAAARSSVSGRSDWWVPVLFTRIRDGQLWANELPPITGSANITLEDATVRAEGTVSEAAKEIDAVQVTSTDTATVNETSSVTIQASPAAVTVGNSVATVTGEALRTTPASASDEAEQPFELGEQRGADNDEVAQEDLLDVQTYITVFADLIESRYTAPPLTIGIYGSWGMGKSFILEGIARTLEDRQKERPKRLPRVEERAKLAHVHRVHVVSFNAWEYSASEVVWPGLVRKIMDHLEQVVFWKLFGAFAYRFRRNFTRNLQRRAGQIFLVSALLLISAAFFFWMAGFNWQLFVSLAFALGVAGISKVIGETLAEPLSKWVGTLFEQEEYGKQIGYMSLIREDLSELEKRLRTQDSRVLVIIDDLDRCEPDKAVAVLQAIKLLLNFDSFIVCIGIDARVITGLLQISEDCSVMR